MKLKYHFEAEFTDGSIFKQNLEDRSIKDPTKSSTTDLFELMKEKILKTFTLVENKFLLASRYSVNLITGEFNINGIDLLLAPKQNLLSFKPKLNLVFFRQRKERLDINVEFQEKDGKVVPVPINNGKQNQYSMPIVYFIGWECEQGGEKYQQLLGIK